MDDLAKLRPQQLSNSAPCCALPSRRGAGGAVRHKPLYCTAGMVQDVLPRHSEMADPSLGNVDRILLVFACALPTFDTLQVGAVRPAMSLTPSGGRRSAVGALSVCCTPLTCCTPPACSFKLCVAPGEVVDVHLVMLAHKPI